jgi:hypothetical protein
MKTPQLICKALPIVWLALLAAILSLAFLEYLQPAFVLDLANRFVFC